MKSFLKANKITLFLFICLNLFISQSEACRIIPVEKNKTKYLWNLIKGSNEIYWAEAVSYSEQDEAFTFKVIEVIRGEKKQSVIYSGKPLSGSEKEISDRKNDYKSHREQKFWDASFEGRTQFDTMCRLNPQFEIGERYLLLSKTPFQPKSFEIVKSSRDRWYQHVRDTIYPPKKKKPISNEASAGDVSSSETNKSSTPEATQEAKSNDSASP